MGLIGRAFGLRSGIAMAKIPAQRIVEEVLQIVPATARLDTLVVMPQVLRVGFLEKVSQLLLNLQGIPADEIGQAVRV